VVSAAGRVFKSFQISPGFKTYGREWMMKHLKKLKESYTEIEAIVSYCSKCIGQEISDRAGCDGTICPLWPFRVSKSERAAAGDGRGATISGRGIG
jgi:hypothetical protein